MSPFLSPASRVARRHAPGLALAGERLRLLPEQLRLDDARAFIRGARQSNTQPIVPIVKAIQA